MEQKRKNPPSLEAMAGERKDNLNIFKKKIPSLVSGGILCFKARLPADRKE
jgi:hypothetical protein